MSGESRPKSEDVELPNPTSFDDYSFKVKQAMVRKKYKILDSDDEPVFKAKPKLMKMKDEIPIKNMDDEVVARVKARQRMDVSGSYDVVDEETGEKIAVLDSQLDFLTQNWTVREPENESKVAELQSRSKIYGALRSISEIMQLLPHRYDIYEPQDNDIGSAEGQLSRKDTYEVNYSKDTDLNSFVLALTIISIDAFEEN